MIFQANLKNNFICRWCLNSSRKKITLINFKEKCGEYDECTIRISS